MLKNLLIKMFWGKRFFHVSKVLSHESPSKPGLLDSLKNAMKPANHMSELLNSKGNKEVDTNVSEGFEDDDEEWVDMFNPDTGEWNGPRHGEPTKFGDWQSKGRTSDFS